MNVLLNGVVVAANLQLVNAGASINMTLQSGENALDIEALGVGDIPPNTAAFTVTDTNGLELGE